MDSLPLYALRSFYMSLDLEFSLKTLRQVGWIKKEYRGTTPILLRKQLQDKQPLTEILGN